jgi:flagellar biosynthesis GTPase FlhF
MRKNLGAAVLSFALSSFVGLSPISASADADDPPTRVARLAYVAGDFSVQPAGTDEWVAAPVNRPLTTGDKLWSDSDGRIELQLDGSLLRLGATTSVSFLNLGDEITQVQLSSGTLLVRVRRLDDDETYEIDTPNLAFSILRPGLYRITVDESGNTTAISVRSGQGEVTGAGYAYSVYPNESDTFSGVDPLTEDSEPLGPDRDALEAWGADRDERWQRSESARYVSPDVVGYQDLDDQGDWRPSPGYGYVWYPRAIEPGWAPYHSGHWTYIAPWGYTWVDDHPWGYAPFHYGRWVFEGGAWGWIPAPPHIEGDVYVRPVYAPALVAWVGVGAGVAWVALGPREVFVPSYPVSRAYVNNVNVSNTTVNTTVINNVYNTTIVNNKTINVTTINYANRSVPGAVAAVSTQAFASAQPVSRNLVRVDPRALSNAPTQSFAPKVVPERQAALGTGRLVAAKPPAAVQSRAVVARTAPPPPPPAFEARAQAIRSNGGAPLSMAQARQIQPAAGARTIAVRIAPPAMAAPRSARAVVTPARPQAPVSKEAKPSGAPPLARPAEVARPGEVPRPPEAARPPVPAVHPVELPPTPKPPSPAVANSALERQHLQEQQQLAARQAQDRQRLQQQQEVEHEQVAKQQAEAQRQRELEAQHQQQTQALAEQHAQEQQEMLNRQRAAQQQAAAKAPPPKNPKDEHPPH